MPVIPTLALNTGAEIPTLGLGTARVEDQEIRRIVRESLDVGYRLIDTAAVYGNEAGVGQGIADSGVRRGDIFVTTKLRGNQQGRASAREGLAGSLQRLGLDYVDLYLIHWPLPRLDEYLDSWLTMEELQADGGTRAIGVSNFLPEHLDWLAGASSTVPAVNQVELHPRFPQLEQRADDDRRGIVTESWSPLANSGLLRDPTVEGIASRLGRSPAQVLLRWHIQQGLVAIPKASHLDRLRENFDIFDFTLSDDDLDEMATLDTGQRVAGQDPRSYEEF